MSIPIKAMTTASGNVDIIHNPSRLIWSNTSNSMSGALNSLKQAADQNTFGISHDHDWYKYLDTRYAKVVIGIRVNTWTKGIQDLYRAYGTEVILTHQNS